MGASTGPALAAGGVVIFNNAIIHDATPASQMRVAIATGIVAIGLSLFERALPQAATAFAWLILTGVILVRIDPHTPSPAESIVRWYNGQK